MFRRLLPATCSACQARIPRSAAGRCPLCRTEFVAVTQAAASPRGGALRTSNGEGDGHAMLRDARRRS